MGSVGNYSDNLKQGKYWEQIVEDHFKKISKYFNENVSYFI